MVFPSVISTFTNPNPTDKLNSPSHSGIETAQNNELIQIETVIGIAGANSVLGTIITDLRSPASSGGGHVQAANAGGTGQISYTKGDILVASSTSVLSKLTVGADNQVLAADSSQSAGVKWSDLTTKVMTIATDFSTAARYNYASVNGAISYSSDGVQVGTSAIASSMGQLVFKPGNVLNTNVFAAGTLYSASFGIPNFTTTGEAFVGLGTASVSAAGHVFSKEHIGFKVLIRNSTASIYATNADGVTEKATALTTITTNDQIDAIVRVNSPSSVDYLFRKNGSIITGITNHSLNIPSIITNNTAISVSNGGVAVDTTLSISGATIQR